MIYLEVAIQVFSLIYSFYFKYTYGIPIGGSFPVELQVLPAVLVEIGFIVGVSQVVSYFITYFVNSCFGGTAS